MSNATLSPHEMQLMNEYRFSRKFIDGYIKQEILDNPDMVSKVFAGVERLNQWIEYDHGYQSKNDRLAQLKGLDFEALVMTVYVKIAYCQAPELFTSVSSQLAHAVGFDDHRESILTMAEIVAVLCQLDAFDIIKTDRSASLQVQSRIPLSERLLTFVSQTKYLPPLVCEPEKLTRNNQSVYLTHNDSLLLGKKNLHFEDICLDVLNIQNAIPLKLDTDFISTVEEEPTFQFKDQQQIDNWKVFKVQSYETYLMLAKQGNRFWIGHKYDTRGRMYASAYHVNYMGTSFKKCLVDFADEEVVEGVPQ